MLSQHDARPSYDIVTLTASCGLMFKFEWPLVLPDNEHVQKLAQATYDIDEYVVDIAKKEGLAPGLSAVEGGVTAHMACHARAQNMGPKSAEMRSEEHTSELQSLMRPPYAVFGLQQITPNSDELSCLRAHT